MMYRSARGFRGGTLRLSTGYARPPVDKSKDPEFWAEQDGKIEALSKQRSAELPENWPDTRKLALLFIHRSDNALAIIAKLSNSNIRPRQHDFAALRNHGYATKNLGDRYHKLTPAGRRAAKVVAFALGNSLGMHLPEFIFDSWSEHRARCCCGWSASVNRRANARAAERLGEEFQKHLADPHEWIRQKDAVAKVIASIGSGARTLPVRAEQPDDIDRPHMQVYGEGDAEAWPDVDDPCDQSPSGFHIYDALNDPERCKHCKRKT